MWKQVFIISPFELCGKTRLCCGQPAARKIRCHSRWFPYGSYCTSESDVYIEIP